MHVDISKEIRCKMSFDNPLSGPSCVRRSSLAESDFSTEHARFTPGGYLEMGTPAFLPASVSRCPGGAGIYDRDDVAI